MAHTAAVTARVRAERERFRVFIWAAHARGENPYRDDMAAQLNLSLHALARHIRVLRREGRYPQFPHKRYRSQPQMLARATKTTEVLAYLRACESRGHLPTNREIGEATGIGRQVAHDHVNRLRALGICPPVNLKRGGSGFPNVPTVTRADVESEKRAILRERGIHA